jgi:hypothetical protein
MLTTSDLAKPISDSTISLDLKQADSPTLQELFLDKTMVGLKR